MGLLIQPTRHLSKEFKMKSFIAVSALAATAMAAPSGPIHPAFGDLVATKRGLRPISLEGYSEDDNQDGFVDPVGQVAYAHHAIPAVAPAPLLAHAPITYAAAPVVTKVEAPKVEKLELPAAPVVTYAAAPAVTYAAAPAPLVHSVPVTYTHTVPVSRTYTQTVPLGVHRTVHASHHVGALSGLVIPGVVAAEAPAKAEE